MIQAHNRFIDEYPRTYLYLACLVGYLVSWLAPEGMGISDYLFAFFVSLGIYTAASNVHIKHEELKIVKAILIIEFMAMFITGMAAYDGFIQYIGFWFDNYPAMLGVLNTIELLILMAGVPWGDIFDSITNRAYKLWLNSHYGVNHRQGFNSSSIKIQETEK